MPTPELAGKRILVTRPKGQETRLCELIEAAGGEAIRFPVLEIAPAAQAPAALARLAQFDLFIFISPNAVTHGMNLIEQAGGLPTAARLATVGQGSARELQQRLGRAVDIVPGGRFNSESLLAEPAMADVAGKRVLILRGKGGRELLANTLRERGAEVEYAEVYQRLCPAAEGRPWEQAIDIITVTSGEGLRNLYAMVGQSGRTWLRQTPLLVINGRLGEIAHELGIATTVVSRQASDDSIVEALSDWARQTSQ